MLASAYVAASSGTGAPASQAFGPVSCFEPSTGLVPSSDEPSFDPVEVSLPPPPSWPVVASDPPPPPASPPVGEAESELHEAWAERATSNARRRITARRDSSRRIISPPIAQPGRRRTSEP